MRGVRRGIFATVLAVGASVGLPGSTGTAGADSRIDETVFVDRINRDRVGRGLAPLVVDVRLRDVARQWSATMAAAGRLSHNGNLAAQAPPEWRRLGENVGMGPSALAVADAFVASPDHFRNIVHPDFNAVGVGVVWSGGILWVTQVFMQSPVTVAATASSAGPGWYRIARVSGDVHSFGTAAPFAKAPTAAPIAAVASTRSGGGYWQAAADGTVFASGAAPYHGGMPAGALNAPIVGMAATRSDGGYWLLGRDGGIFSFGDARFFGSTGGVRLNRPVLGMAATPSGNGYWLVASDGGIFAFGDARFFGSTGAVALNQPIVGMAPTSTGNGYWLVAADGGVFAFGDASYLGSGAGIPLGPVVGMVGGSA